jgi:hypothetical protein
MKRFTLQRWTLIARVAINGLGGKGERRGDALAPRQIGAPVQVPPERRRPHVVLRPAKARLSPATVGGFPSRVPPATQTWHVPVMDPRALQSRRQRGSFQNDGQPFTSKDVARVRSRCAPNSTEIP